VKDAALGVAEDVPRTCHRTWRRTWGPGGTRPPRHATATAAAFEQLALRCGRNWAAQWHLARAVGKASSGIFPTAAGFLFSGFCFWVFAVTKLRAHALIQPTKAQRAALACMYLMPVSTARS